MSTRFIRFTIGAIMFFSAITEWAMQTHNWFGWIFSVPFPIRATLAFGGAYLLINTIQKSDEP